MRARRHASDAWEAFASAWHGGRDERMSMRIDGVWEGCAWSDGRWLRRAVLRLDWAMVGGTCVYVHLAALGPGAERADVVPLFCDVAVT